MWPRSGRWPTRWPGPPDRPGLRRAGPGPGAGGGPGGAAGLQAGHDALVADDHPGRGLGHRGGDDRRRVRRHGLAPRPPGRYRSGPRPTTPDPRWQGDLRPFQQLGGGPLLPVGRPGVLSRRQGGQGAGRDGLTCDAEGRPVAVEVFAGNTADPTAFISAAQAVRERFGLADVVMVGDRGMITTARIEALKAVGGLGWLTSAGPCHPGPGRVRGTPDEPVRRGQLRRDSPPFLPR